MGYGALEGMLEKRKARKGMSQQHYFTDLKLDRIFMILRRGGLVIIKDERGRASLVRAAEFADFTPEILTGLVLDNEILCLTSRHMQAFGKAIHADLPCYSLPAATLSMAQTHALILGDGSALPDEANWLGERANSLPDIACRLLRAARLIPAALLTRISINDSAQLHHMADNYHIPILEFHEVALLKQDIPVEMSITSSAKLPLAVAQDAKIIMFRQKHDRNEHFAVLIGADTKEHPPLVRLHSQCVTGDILGSLKCDCGPQLQAALTMMKESGFGILLYLAQEGRDIGLLNKIRAYALQDQGMDTVDANHRLGFETDERLFGPAAAMLKAMNIDKIRLLTNNPDKIEQLQAHGISVTERVSLSLPANDFNKDYLDTKARRTGHFIAPD